MISIPRVVIPLGDVRTIQRDPGVRTVTSIQAGGIVDRIRGRRRRFSVVRDSYVLAASLVQLVQRDREL